MKKMIKYSEWLHSDVWWECIFNEYMRVRHPDMLKYNPRLDSLTKDKIRFGMKKHMGVLVASKKKVIEELFEYFCLSKK
jgi:hypothetical protein